MTETTRIQDQLQRALDGDAWHGPSLKAILAGVTAEKAAAKPRAHEHSIWELVLHIITWQRVPIRRLAGEAVEPAESENFPRVTDVSEAAWQQTLAGLDLVHYELRTAIGKLTDARLDDLVAGQKYSIYVMLHGVVQHNIYHAGQIALLKKR